MPTFWAIFGGKLGNFLFHHFVTLKLTLNEFPRTTSSVFAARGGDAACDVIAVSTGVIEALSSGSQIMAVSTEELDDEAEFFGIAFSMSESKQECHSFVASTCYLLLPTTSYYLLPPTTYYLIGLLKLTGLTYLLG